MLVGFLCSVLQLVLSCMVAFCVIPPEGSFVFRRAYEKHTEMQKVAVSLDML